MEKFAILFRTYDELYSKGSPVVISARALVKENTTGKVYAQLKFRNISDKNIKALKISVKAFDSFGAQIEEIPEYQYSDLNAKRNEEFGNKRLIAFENENVRSFEVKCTEFLFSEGSIKEFEKEADWFELPKQVIIEHKLGSELAEQYCREISANAKFSPDSIFDIWRCICGTVNKDEEKFCVLCGKEREKIMEALDEENLSVKLADYEEEARIKAEEARIEAERKAEAERIKREQEKEKEKRIKTIVFPILAVAIVAFIAFYSTVLKPQFSYDAAVQLMESGQYKEAVAEFKTMKDYKDSASLITECEYRYSENLLKEGKYNEAIASFEKLGSYKESKEKITECKYLIAVGKLEAGEFEKAISDFEALGNYKDSAQKITECQNGINEEKYQEAKKLFKERKYEKAIAAFEELGDYKDSKNQIENVKKEIVYQEALELFNDGKYKKARTKFKEIKDYRDSAQKIEQCNKKLNSSTSSGITGSVYDPQQSYPITGFRYYTLNSIGDVVKFYVTCNRCGKIREIAIDYRSVKRGSQYRVTCGCGNKGYIPV